MNFLPFTQYTSVSQINGYSCTSKTKHNRGYTKNDNKRHENLKKLN